MLFLFLAVGLLVNTGSARASDSGEHVAIPSYVGWPLEQEATTYRPGTDLQFYPLELKIYVNPKDPAEMVVELRRRDVLYILYHYTITNQEPFIWTQASQTRRAASSTLKARLPGATSGSTFNACGIRSAWTGGESVKGDRT